MNAESRSKLWLVAMLVFGVVMTLIWSDVGLQLVQRIARLLAF